jgi:hypothetical protein
MDPKIRELIEELSEAAETEAPDGFEGLIAALDRLAAAIESWKPWSYPYTYTYTNIDPDGTTITADCYRAAGGSGTNP